MINNLSDKQKEVFRRLVACMENLQLRPFGVSRGPAGSLWINELEEKSPEFNLRDFNEYVKAGLLDKIGENHYVISNFGLDAIANNFQETHSLTTKLERVLLDLHTGLDHLRTQEADQGGEISASVKLRNEIARYERAVKLTSQMRTAANDLQQELDSVDPGSDLATCLISILGKK